MDIKRAKQEIEHAVKAYLAVDDTGTPLIPPIRQRPILLMGPPGVWESSAMLLSLPWQVVLLFLLLCFGHFVP